MNEQHDVAMSREARVKRIRMRSWRRGMREMDLILGPFADAEVPSFDDGGLERFEQLLEINDQTLYAWVSGVEHPAPQAASLVAALQRWHGIG